MHWILVCGEKLITKVVKKQFCWRASTMQLQESVVGVEVEVERIHHSQPTDWLEHFSQGQVTLNLYGGKFYNKTPEQGNTSIWSRRGTKPGREGREKKSRLSNIKTTFLTPIGTQSGYRKSKASMSRRFSPERNESLKVMIAVKTILKLKWNFFSI